MSIKHHFHGCQKRRWYVLRLLSGAISSTWLYLFFYSVLPVLDTTERCRVKKAVVGVTELIAALVPIHGVLAF